MELWYVQHGSAYTTSAWRSPVRKNKARLAKRAYCCGCIYIYNSVLNYHRTWKLEALMTVGTICRQHAFSKKRNPVSFPVSYYIGYDAKIIWKIIWKSPRAFCFLINNAVWVQTMQKLFEKSSETNRKTERIARLNVVRSTNSQIQPNTRTAQCAGFLFMFLLAVLSHNQIF